MTEAELIGTILAATAGEADLDRILRTVLHHLGQVTAITGGAIVLVEEDNLITYAALGSSAEDMDDGDLPLAQGIAWQVIETGEPWMADDPRMTDLAPTTPIRSSLVVPLTWHGDHFGVLEVDSTQSGAFDEADLALVQKVAATLSGSIELARRHTAAVRAVEAAEAAHQQLTLQYTVSRLLAEADHFNEVAQPILQAFGKHLSWDVGVMWCIDRASNRLKCTAFWHTPTSPVAAFKSHSQVSAFAPGVGLPGRVWHSREPVWLSDLHQDDNFPRLRSAAAAGLRSAFAFPLQDQSELFGVMEFFSQQVQPPDEALVQSFATIGQQIGQYIRRKRAEATVRQGELRHNAMLEVALDAVITIDLSGKVVEWNSVAEQMFGYSRAETLGQEMATLIIPPSLRAQHQQGLARYLATGEHVLLGQRIEVTAMRADGTEFPVELSVTQLPSDGEPLFIGFVRDITARKQAEENLRFLAEMSPVLAASLDYETTLANIAHLAVPYLADWCTIDILEEDGTPRLLAVEHADPAKVALAYELRERYPPDPNACGGLYKVLQTGRQELVAHIDDSYLQAATCGPAHLALVRQLGLSSLMMVPLVARGRILGAITLATGDSGREYRSADLLLAMELAHRASQAVDNARLYHEAQEAIQLRDRFLAIASHELKTPITSLLGYTTLLQRRLSPDKGLTEREHRRLRVIHTEAARLNRLVDLLLDVSRLQSDHLEMERAPVDLCALVRRLVELIQPTLDVHTLELRCPDDAILVQGDELRLEQMLQNLINNAIKYSPQGGPISVQVERHEDQARIAISDRGIGIPPDALTALYDRFFRAPNACAHGINGFGLGLYLVKEILTRHGGTIEVESREAEGSTFTVTLPLGPATTE
ncbi:MAG: GAF domain-containing protein [Chloroflexota bacterium]|nr:GAF domain-containing protein [Chloroflexota bacterium]